MDGEQQHCSPGISVADGPPALSTAMKVETGATLIEEAEVTPVAHITASIDAANRTRQEQFMQTSEKELEQQPQSWIPSGSSSEPSTRRKRAYSDIGASIPALLHCIPGPAPPSKRAKSTRRAARASLPSVGKRPRTTSGKTKKKSNSRQSLKTLRPPRESFPPATDDVKVCAFCSISGSQRAVEGDLVGPFESQNGKKFYGHRNCILWAPEVWMDPARYEFLGVDLALKRANTAKCRLCGDNGATLTCTYHGKKCCRPMHFRCALLKGAALILDGGFQTLCPVHAQCGINVGDPPVSNELLHVQTPVPIELMAHDSLPVCCDGDNHDPEKGSLLHCGNCKARIHTKCLSSSLNFHGAFAVYSAEGSFRCKQCLVCDMCMEAISQCRSDDIVQCSGCKHRTVHRHCAGDGVKDSRWRCDTCRCCRHCQQMVENASEWNEVRQACKLCDAAHEGQDAVICPTCTKVWREGNDLPMIQCDGCDLWLHSAEECSDLTVAQLEKLNDNDIPYFCTPCNQKKAVAASAAAARSKRPSRANGRSRARRKEGNVEAQTVGTLEYASSDEEDGAEFHFHQKGATSDLNVAPAIGDSAPHAELCLQCASGGCETSFRFCAGCGEAFHGFCVGAGLPERGNGPFISPYSGTVHRVSAGGTGPGSRLWRCTACTVCIRCAESESESNMIVLCDHCDRGVHLTCLSPPLEKPPEGDFKCDECKLCEMCGRKDMNTVRVREHSFCHSCAIIVEQAKVCPLCHVRYPQLAAVPQSNLPAEVSPAGTPELPGAFLTGAKCAGCSAVVHASCDPFVSAYCEYRCPHCREVQVGNTAPVVGGTIPDLKRAATSLCSSSSGDSLAQVNGADTMEGVTLAFAEELDVSHPVTSSHGHSRWSVDSIDRRSCEFCRRGESEKEIDHHDRLLPFAPDPGSTGPHVWVHASCMLWTPGVDRFNDIGRKLVLLSSRRILLARARSKTCSQCKTRGASLICAERACSNVYHLRCGMEADMKCVLHDGDPDGKSPNLYPRQELFCLEHSSTRPEAVLLRQVHDSVSFLRSVRMARLRSPANVSRRKALLKQGNLHPKSLVRVGSLTVVSLGRLVPDCADFVARDSLVPTGYRGTRKHWSMTRASERTLYHLQVTGDSSSGPIFSVWAEDDPDLVLQNTCADALWSRVQERIEFLRGSVANQGEGMLCKMPRLGLEAFGLRKCRPVVTLVESLPLNWMLAHRYKFRFRQPVPINDDSVSLLAGLQILQEAPQKSSTGCARTEGYIPKRHRKTVKDDAIPLYKSIPTGELFQLKVAMEAEGQGEFAPQVSGMSGQNSSQYARAAEANAVAGEAAPAYGGHGKRKTGDSETNPQNLSFATQYRMMRERGKKTIVLRSRIEGLGVFALDVFKEKEMVIEYVGDVIRPSVSDIREARYNNQNIGCYMFSITKDRIVDATMKGNAARYINHSCDPNCYSKNIVIENGVKVVAIFAKRLIKRGEELSYDYLFPLDEADKALCGCGSAKCKGFMN